MEERCWRLKIEKAILKSYRSLDVGRLETYVTGELGLVCKQPGFHTYKRTTVGRLNILNQLDRKFDVEQPDRGWYGDIIYIWMGSAGAI
ncbi:hypothetical protein ABO04_07995 [Nitrosomonas sp. HPC101]|nr:hypothetical protein [Nitrosomonas sp. HPC101]